MDKEIVLVEYNDRKHTFTIPNFEDVKCIMIKILSGDETADVSYNSGRKINFDSSYHRRISYYDGCYELDKKDIDKFNKFDGNSYERQREFYKNL